MLMNIFHSHTLYYIFEIPGYFSLLAGSGLSGKKFL